MPLICPCSWANQMVRKSRASASSSWGGFTSSTSWPSSVSSAAAFSTAAIASGSGLALMADDAE